MPTLARITLFPIKSLDGTDVSEARVLPSGALQHDRRWAMIDEEGSLVTGKRAAAVHSLRATFSQDMSTAELQQGDDRSVFQLDRGLKDASEWISQKLGRPCRLVEDSESGFPDDIDAPGPTVISAASLDVVAGWFNAMPLEEVRRRFRTNLEISDCQPFWEDRLANASRDRSQFVIGNVRFQGRRVCQRCVVPTRHPHTGETTPGFSKRFAARRQHSLPKDSPGGQFDHFYRIAINTSLLSRQNGDSIRVGDAVQWMP